MASQAPIQHGGANVEKPPIPARLPGIVLAFRHAMP
jgi:hypothetical protein